MGGALPRYLFSCGNLGGLSCHPSILGCPVGPHLPLFAVVLPPQHLPRSLPSPLLNKNPHPIQSPMEIAPLSAHLSTQWHSRIPAVTKSSTRRGTTTLATCQTPTPRTDRRKTSAANSLPSFAFACHENAKRPTPYEALTVNRRSILGNSPPREVRDKFVAWTQAVKQRSKWSLDGIAQSVFIIARHVHDRQEKIRKNEGWATKDSKIIALVLMYSFFLSEINLAEADRQSQNQAALSNLQQAKPKAMKPLPTNFRYDGSRVSFLLS